MAVVLVFAAASFVLVGSATGFASQTAVGDMYREMSDAVGQWHILWMIRDAGFSVTGLASTTVTHHPDEVSMVARIAFLPDAFLLAGMQQLFGLYAGYNLAVWMLLTGLGMAVYLCARRWAAGRIAAVGAGLLVMASPTVATEAGNGRLYYLLALAFVALFTAEIPAIIDGQRRAVIMGGIWFALTALAHWFSGLMLVLVVLIPAGFWLWKAGRKERRGHMLNLAYAVGVAVLLALPVAIYVFSNIDVAPNPYLAAKKTSIWARMLPWGTMDDAFGRTMEWALSPLAALESHRLRWGLLVLVLLLVDRVRKDRIGMVLFGTMFVVGLLVAWGPYVEPAGRGGIRIPLPLYGLYYVVPFLWRQFWVDRVLLFVDLALAVILARHATAWLVDRTWKWRMPAVSVAVLMLLGETALSGFLPLPASQAYDRLGSTEQATADGLREFAGRPETGPVVALPQALFFQTIHGLHIGRPDLVRKPDGEYFVPSEETLLELRGMGFTHLVVFTAGPRVGKDFFENLTGVCPPEDTAKRPAVFRTTLPGRRLEAVLGPPEVFGVALVYPTGSVVENVPHIQ